MRNPPPATAPEELAEVFTRDREQIMDEWRERAGHLLRELNLDQPTLTDHLPDLVAEIIRNLAHGLEGEPPVEHSSGSPPVHGVQRVYDGLNVDEVVAEYNLLRVAFIVIAERNGLHVVGRAARIINHGIDEAVRQAVAAFAKQQTLIRQAQVDEHLAFIAHDLRTPLNAVSLLVGELRQGLDPKTLAEAGDLFEMLGRNVQRLDLLIKRVLDAHVQTTVKGSAFHPAKRTFELWPLVQRLIHDLRPLAAQDGITMLNEIPRALTVEADAGLLAQVFQNLLTNAFKYAPGGRVVVQARDDAGAITCTVCDDGAGIPAELLPRIFEKLATDPEKEGTGLGLAIVKQIVEAHGGAASAESTPGNGATFTFTLPVAPQD